MTYRLVIVLPNGRSVGVGTYARAWKELKKAEPNSLWPGFAHFPERAADILAAMRGGLSERINRHDRRYGAGRKWSNEWFCETYRAAAIINRPRLVIDWLPPWLKERFSYRLRRNT